MSRPDLDISRTPAPSEAFKTGPERPKACAACRGYHGGVNAGIRCLELELERQRANVKRLAEDLEAAAVTIGSLRAGVRTSGT